jgi:hypothetical protein
MMKQSPRLINFTRNQCNDKTYFDKLLLHDIDENQIYD